MNISAPIRRRGLCLQDLRAAGQGSYGSRRLYGLEGSAHLLQYPAHADFHDFMIRLNALYLEDPALWEADDAAEGFSWVDLGCEDPGVFGYMRRPAGADQKKGLLVILNFSDEDAEISLRLSGSIETLMNTGLIWNALNNCPAHSRDLSRE